MCANKLDSRKPIGPWGPCVPAVPQLKPLVPGLFIIIVGKLIYFEELCCFCLAESKAKLYILLFYSSKGC